MMVLVAVAALSLVIAIPVGHRLIWLYQRPVSAVLFIGGVEFSPIRSPDPDAAGRPRHAPFLLGRPVEARCSYRCEPLPSVPAGLLFRVSIVTNLMNPPFTVLESLRESHLLVAGVSGWKDLRGEFSCRLTPRQPGSQMVQYEVIVTDIFGRERRAALHTSGFEAK
jgi:hypothetical protein